MPPKKPAPPTLGPAAALIGSDCDSDYDSADDSDFDPSSATAAAAAAAPGDDDDSDLSVSSSDEGDAGAKHAPGPRKRKRALSTSSETASGGIIQTRAQRALGAKSDRPQAARLPSGAVTTDVDALWAEMNSSSAAAFARPGPSTATTTAATSTATPATAPAATPAATTTTTTAPTPAEAVHPDTGEKMVAITHTYEFAGKTVTETKLVSASSETARVHFSSTAATATTSSTSSHVTAGSPTAPARRPPPKKRASAFDSAAASRNTSASGRQAHHCQPAKINTLEKSRMDWAGFVDKEGIGDDLKRWNKGDKAYLDRQAFLGRVDENRDRQWKEAHKK